MSGRAKRAKDDKYEYWRDGDGPIHRRLRGSTGNWNEVGQTAVPPGILSQLKTDEPERRRA